MLSSVLIALAVMAAAVPYVALVRHPDQKPFIAYLVFVIVFSLTAVVLFVVLAWLAATLQLTDALGTGGMAVLLLLLGVAPALGVATWQARRPPRA